MDNNAIIGFSLMAVFALIYLLFRKNPEITAYSEGKRFRCVLAIYALRQGCLDCRILGIAPFRIGRFHQILRCNRGYGSRISDKA